MRVWANRANPMAVGSVSETQVQIASEAESIEPVASCRPDPTRLSLSLSLSLLLVRSLALLCSLSLIASYQPSSQKASLFVVGATDSERVHTSHRPTSGPMNPKAFYHERFAVTARNGQAERSGKRSNGRPVRSFSAFLLASFLDCFRIPSPCLSRFATLNLFETSSN
jgi:hypothetical protein